MILNYNVPQLGKVTSRLYDEAVNCYDFLDYYSYIEKMKTTDQLGVIRGIHEGAHHSRWEYVMVQLSLIHQLSTLKDDDTGRNVANGLGLQKKINFLGHEISGAGILQIWILLFNSGHLPGTYSTERGILRHYENNNKFQKIFYDGLPKNCLHIMDKVVKEQDIYTFHKALICFQLQRNRGSRCYLGNDFIDLLFEVINYYFPKNEPSQSQKNLLNLYNRIRQLSFLFLDSQYLSFPLNFDLSKIFFNFSYYLNDLFKKQDSIILRTLDSFEDLLSINVYHSAEAISGLGLHSKKIEESDKICRINTITELKEYLKDYYYFYPDFEMLYKDKEIFHMLFEINFTFSFINEHLIKKFRNFLSYETEEKLKLKYGNRCNLAFQSANRSKQMAIALTVPNSRMDKNLKVIGKYLKDFINFNINLKKEESPFIKDIIDDVIQKPYQELFLSIINYVSDENVTFEIKNENISKSIMPINTSLKHYTDEIDKVIDNSDLEKYRQHEIRTLNESLRNLKYRSGWLVSLSPIDVFDKNRDPITDIDGGAIGFRDGKIGILLVEAKNQRHGSLSAAETQLENNIKDLKFKTSYKSDLVKIIGPQVKGVYSYIILDGKQ